MIRSAVKLSLKASLLPLKLALKALRRVASGGGDTPPDFSAPAPAPPTPPGQHASPSPFDVQIDPGKLVERLAAGEELVFVDVRQAQELAASGRIPGALHIPSQDLPRRLEELDSGREVFVYCASGVRSLDAVMFLREKGFEEAWSLGGGIAHWQQDGGEVVRD